PLSAFGADGAAIFSDVCIARNAGVDHLGIEDRWIQGGMVSAQRASIVGEMRRDWKIDSVVAIGSGKMIDLHGWLQAWECGEVEPSCVTRGWRVRPVSRRPAGCSRLEPWPGLGRAFCSPP